MAKTKPGKPNSARADRLDRRVLGVTREGIRILRQPDSEHFTQDQALEAARRVVAARALRVEEISDEAKEALKSVEMDPRRAPLDAIVDDE
jgi:hypothetical protein